MVGTRRAPPAGKTRSAWKWRTRCALASARAGKQTRVRFIPDDVHVVVIIIIAFCIITIISAATSVIYSRSRVCIMRAGRLRALITTLPCLFIGIPQKIADDRDRGCCDGVAEAVVARECTVTHDSETVQEVNCPSAVNRYINCSPGSALDHAISLHWNVIFPTHVSPT